MTELSRERLEELSNHQHVGAILSDEIAEMARRLLAAESQEPVAWTDAQELRDVEKHGCGYLFTVNPITPNADPRRVIKLYAEPQTVALPVVDLPSEFYSSEGVVVQLEKVMAALAVCGIKYERKGNACRAAMLNAEPVSQPYRLPDGWKIVPVEPTHDMLNAWLSEIANWRGHVAGYKAMLAAAPAIPEFTTQAVDADNTSTQFESLSAQDKPRCICIECGTAVPNPEKPHRCVKQEPTK